MIDTNQLQNDILADKCTKGKVVTSVVKVFDKLLIGVRIDNTPTVIAICGTAGAPDEEESWANAERIAEDWNTREERSKPLYEVHPSNDPLLDVPWQRPWRVFHPSELSSLP